MSDHIGESQVKLGCLLQNIEIELQARRACVDELLSEMLAIEQQQWDLAKKIDDLKARHQRTLRECQLLEIHLAQAREGQL